VDQVTEKPQPATALDRWWWVAAIAMIVVVLALIGLSQLRERNAMDGATAADSRDELNQVVLDTATAMGLAVEPEDVPTGPLTCTRPGGGAGESYFLQKAKGPVVEDVDSALAAVRTMWEGLGYAVSDRAIDTARGLSATTTDGGSMYILTGPGGTIIAGESACAHRTPESPDSP